MRAEARALSSGDAGFVCALGASTTIALRSAGVSGHGGRGLAGGVLGPGYVQLEGGPLADLRVQDDPASVGLENLLRDRQAETRSAPARREEDVEDLVAHIGRNARAVVHDPDDRLSLRPDQRRDRDAPAGRQDILRVD